MAVDAGCECLVANATRLAEPPINKLREADALGVGMQKRALSPGQDDSSGGHCAGRAAAFPHVYKGVPHRHRRPPLPQARLNLLHWLQSRGSAQTSKASEDQKMRGCLSTSNTGCVEEGSRTTRGGSAGDAKRGQPG